MVQQRVVLGKVVKATYGSYCLSCELAISKQQNTDKRETKRARMAVVMAQLMPPAVAIEPALIGASDAATSLHRLTAKALSAMEHILDMPYPPADDPAFIKIMAEKRQTATAILAGQIRVDENMLRHRSDDTMKKLLDTIEGKAKVAGLLN